jgi:hypothetical protein
MLVADYFVDHQLAVNALYCFLKFASLPEKIVFRRWIAFSEPIAPNLPLIPDGYVEFITTAGPVATFFEVDLGNESLRVWHDKARKYIQLAISGTYERKFGGERFRVLVVANSARRMDSLRRAVSKETEKLFRFATLDAARTDFFGPVWKKPIGDLPEPLIPTTP